MYYIPKKIPFNKLKAKQKEIYENDDFEHLFDMIEREERLILLNQQTVMEYSYVFKKGIDRKPLFYIDVNENGDIVSDRCEMCLLEKTCHHRFQMAFEISEELNELSQKEGWVTSRKEYLRQKAEEEKERLKAEKYQKKRTESMSKVSNLLDSIGKPGMLMTFNPVRIEPAINLHRLRSGQEMMLSLKVGFDKMYIVSDIEEFLDRIKNREEHTYGKSLSFVHDLGNFDEPARKLIRLLQNQRQSNPDRRLSSYLNDKEANISPETVGKILSYYKGQQIFGINLEGNEKQDYYDLTLNPMTIHFRLSPNFVLTTDGLDNYEILDGGDRYFLIHESQIDIAQFADDNLKPLFSFIRQNPKFSFEYIKDVLAKEIIARYHDYIDIDPIIKEEVSLKDFQIESYFDFENEIITCQTRYYDAGKITEEKELTAGNFMLLKLEQYRGLLKSLGLEEGKMTDQDKIFQFLSADLKELKILSTVYLSDRITRMQAKVYKPSVFRLSYRTGMLDVCFEESPYSDEELARIIRGLRKKTRYIKLNKDVILKIDDEDSEKLLNTVDEFNLDISHLNKTQEIPSYQVLKLADKDLDIIDHRGNDELISLLSDIANYKQAVFDTPKEVEPYLRSYQKEAFLWMKTLTKYHFNGILADDMGLGKTLEMISVLLTDNEPKPSLIVCPKSLCFNWKNEFEMWAHDFDVTNIIGPAPERMKTISEIDNQKRWFYITSYDSLRNDVDYYKDKKFQYVILDEAQNIKNHSTLKAQSVKCINAAYRFVLTGTPIENSVMDLWSIFDFLMPGYLNDYEHFRSKYEKPIIEEKERGIIQALVHKISPFILRRIKQDVIDDLPDKIETIQVAPMTDEQRRIYDAERKRTKDLLTLSDNRIDLLACLTRLRQACVDPGMYIEGYAGGSGKVELVMELIDDYLDSGHRILIFSQFTSIFQTIQEELKKRNIRYFILTGKTPAKERVEMAKKFNETDDEKVFLVSLKAGGNGLNLIGADIVIHLDPWWNVAAENQATDRAYRLGQTKAVQVIKLVSEDSIEQKVIELQERKKEIVSLVVADDDTNIQNLTREDINYLLSE